MCCYCGCYFESRNKLFYHLNYMGIDTRKNRSSLPDIFMEYNDDKGDFGIEFEEIKRKRRKRRRRYQYHWLYVRRRRIRKDNKRKNIKDIEKLLENVNIC